MSLKNFGSNRGGYIEMKPKANAKKFSAGKKLASFPKKVDLRPYMTPVEDQGQTNSCTANAVAGACEYLIKKINDEKAYDVSRLFIYYNARKRSGDTIKDEGSSIVYAVESLQKLGCCPEKTWPYQKKIVNQKPDKKSYQLGQRFKITDSEQLPIQLQDWKQALAEGYPIIFGTKLFKDFGNFPKNSAVVSMPSPQEAGRDSHGSHAMLCVGYSEADQLFIVRNSWGNNWGAKGYCYMPYNYLANPNFTHTACILRSSKPIEAPEDTWIDDDEPLINEYVEIETYDPHDYDDVEFEDDEEVYEYEDVSPPEYSEIEGDYYDQKITFDYWESDDLENYQEFDYEEYIEEEGSEEDESEDSNDEEEEDESEDDDDEEEEEESEDDDDEEEEEESEDGDDEEEEDESEDGDDEEEDESEDDDDEEEEDESEDGDDEEEEESEDGGEEEEEN